MEREPGVVEVYTVSGCEHCVAALEDLIWRGVEHVEYRVDMDREALARMLALTGGARTVPVIVENGAVVQTGWMGRGCTA